VTAGCEEERVNRALISHSPMGTALMAWPCGTATWRQPHGDSPGGTPAWGQPWRHSLMGTIPWVQPQRRQPWWHTCMGTTLEAQPHGDNPMGTAPWGQPRWPSHLSHGHPLGTRTCHQSPSQLSSPQRTHGALTPLGWVPVPQFPPRHRDSCPACPGQPLTVIQVEQGDLLGASPAAGGLQRGREMGAVNGGAWGSPRCPSTQPGPHRLLPFGFCLGARVGARGAALGGAGLL